MKYTILMSCGHEDTIDLFGKGADRERKIEYFKAHGLCKNCYQKEMVEQTGNEPFTFNATVLPYINEKNGSILLNVWFDGNTMPHKDAIKSLGDYKWGERKSANDFFSTSNPPMCWNKTIELNSLKKEIENAQSIGAKNIVSDDGLFAMVHYQIAADKHKLWVKKHSDIANIEKPAVPDILKNHRWNQKIYGKVGNYSIYPDGEKTMISDEQATEIEAYLKQLEEYKRKVEEINNA